MPKSVWQLFPGRGPTVQALLRVWEPPSFYGPKPAPRILAALSILTPKMGLIGAGPGRESVHSNKGPACAVGGLLPPPGPAPP